MLFCLLLQVLRVLRVLLLLLLLLVVPPPRLAYFH